MSVTVQNESATTAEAVEVLMEHLPASKVARLLSSWQMGQGDYLKLRDELFAGGTVQGLCEQLQTEPVPKLKHYLESHSQLMREYETIPHKHSRANAPGHQALSKLIPVSLKALLANGQAVIVSANQRPTISRSAKRSGLNYVTFSIDSENMALIRLKD